MKFTEVTIDEVMVWKPCPPYTHERVRELFNGREALTVQDIAALGVPVWDRIWAMLHFFTDEELRSLSRDFAERVVHLADDPRIQTTIGTNRVGKATDGELATAWDAAGDAAWVAAWNAGGAWDVAWNAERQWQMERILTLFSS